AELSGGQRQRVNIAKTLILKPKFVVSTSSERKYYDKCGYSNHMSLVIIKCYKIRKKKECISYFIDTERVQLIYIIVQSKIKKEYKYKNI
ncbi:MAG: hypothetical protein Q8736_02675, partial [Sweet potato little leaf phytoplasma]|nr:hypothetical protein [Sweet potato little leaf phytoplasma]